MNEILTAIAARYSTRGFTQEKLTEEELRALITAGLQAPTAANRQEIHITALPGDHPVLAKLQEELTRDRPGANLFYYGAPTVFILSGDESFPWSPVDAGIAVQSMALAAESLGLGSLIIGCIRGVMTGEHRQELSDALHLPEGHVYQVALAVGHGAAPKAPHEYDWEKNVTVL